MTLTPEQRAAGWRDQEYCPECGGCGYTVGPGCCGNYHPHGGCRGDCAVQTQYACQTCDGRGVIECDPYLPETSHDQ